MRSLLDRFRTVSFPLWIWHFLFFERFQSFLFCTLMNRLFFAFSTSHFTVWTNWFSWVWMFCALVSPPKASAKVFFVPWGFVFFFFCFCFLFVCYCFFAISCQRPSWSLWRHSRDSGDAAVFLAEDPEIEYLFCGAPSGSETGLLFCSDLFCLWLESV